MSDTDILKQLAQRAAKGDKTAFEQLGTLEDAGKVKLWLYRIAANKSINYLKKKQPIFPGDEQLEDIETEENESFLPEEYALNADKREIVLKIIRETCSDVLYQTILLHYFNGFSIAEIAKIMECPEGTVKYRLSVARAKIKEGVLRYEKKSGDKLYSVAVIPFLTALFTAQMQDMQMPFFPLSFPDARPKSKPAAQTASSAKTGGRILLKGVQLKIAVGLAVVAVVGGVAAVVVTTNRNAEEASVGAQEEGTTDVADVENTVDMAASSETGIGETDAGEDDLQEENEIAAEPEMTEKSKGTEKAANKETEAEEEAETAGENKLTEEAETAQTGNEETPESEQQYTYTDMSATMYATQTVNIRTLPSTDGEKVGSLSTNQEIAITGQCNETSWYRFEYNGQTAYVSNSYVSDTKIEVAAAESAASTESAPTQETESAGTSNGVPAGVLDLTTLPREQWVDRGDWLVYVHGVWDEYPAVGDLGPLMASFQTRHPDAEMSAGACKFLKDLGISVVWMQFKYGVSPEADTTLGYYSKYATKRN